MPYEEHLGNIKSISVQIINYQNSMILLVTKVGERKYVPLAELDGFIISKTLEVNIICKFNSGLCQDNLPEDLLRVVATLSPNSTKLKSLKLLQPLVSKKSFSYVQQLSGQKFSVSNLLQMLILEHWTNPRHYKQIFRKK